MTRKAKGYKYFAWYPVWDRYRMKRVWLRIVTKRVTSKGARYSTRRKGQRVV